MASALSLLRCLWAGFVPGCVASRVVSWFFSSSQSRDAQSPELGQRSPPRSPSGQRPGSLKRINIGGAEGLVWLGLRPSRCEFMSWFDTADIRFVVGFGIWFGCSSWLVAQ